MSRTLQYYHYQKNIKITFEFPCIGAIILKKTPKLTKKKFYIMLFALDISEDKVTHSTNSQYKYFLKNVISHIT